MFKPTVTCNNKPRPYIYYLDLTEKEKEYYPEKRHEDHYFFRYKGFTYCMCEVQRAPDGIKALGFDGWIPESFYEAVVLRYFDKDGYEYDECVIVGTAQING